MPTKITVIEKTKASVEPPFSYKISKLRSNAQYAGKFSMGSRSDTHTMRLQSSHYGNFPWCSPFFIFFLTRCLLVNALIVRLQPSPEEIFTEKILLPVQIPRLLQDPQNIPRDYNRPFGFKKGGHLMVDIQLKERALFQNVNDFVSTETSETTAHLWGRPLSELFSFFTYLSSSTDSASTSRMVAKKKGYSITLTSTAWLGFRTGIESIIVALQALGGGIADSVLYGRTQLSSSQVQTLKNLPGALETGLNSILFSFTSLLFGLQDSMEIKTPPKLERLSSSISKLAPMLSTISTRFSNVESNLSDDSIPQNLGFSKFSEFNAVLPGEKIISQGLNLGGERTNITETYILLMTDEQWNILFTKLNSVSSQILSHTSIQSNKVFSSYIKSIVRIPMTTDRVNFLYTIPFTANYRVVLLNPTSEPLQLQGTIELVNPGPNHLSTSEQMEGQAVGAMCILNFITALGLCLCLATVWRDSKTDLHVLMALNFVVKSIYLLLDWRNVQIFTINGELETIYWILPRMISKIQDIISLTLFLLIAFGWKVHRPHLSMLETRALAGVCVLSFYLGVFEVSMGAFQAIRYIVHSLAYLIVIVAINFNVALLGTMVQEMGLSRTTAETYQKCEGYQAFRVIFIIFILKPTILLFYKLSILSNTDEEDWILVVLDNLIDWAIILSLIYAFRPAHNFRLFKDLRIGEQSDEPQVHDSEDITAEIDPSEANNENNEQTLQESEDQVQQ